MCSVFIISPALFLSSLLTATRSVVPLLPPMHVYIYTCLTHSPPSIESRACASRENKREREKRAFSHPPSIPHAFLTPHLQSSLLPHFYAILIPTLHITTRRHWSHHTSLISSWPNLIFTAKKDPSHIIPRFSFPLSPQSINQPKRRACGSDSLQSLHILPYSAYRP